MWTLKDCIDDVTLKTLQDTFSAAAGCPVSICGSKGQPLVIPVMDEDDKEGILSFPVMLERAVAGCIRIKREDNSEVPESYHIQLGTMMADMLARLGDEKIEVRHRIEQLFALHRVTAEISQADDLQKILDNVTRIVVETMKQKASSIRLLSKNDEMLTISSVHSFSPQYMDMRPIPLADSVLDQEVLDSDTPVYVEDMMTDPRVLYKDAAQKEGVVSALCAPMVYNEKHEGILRVFSGELYRFDWFEWQLLRTIANVAAAAIVQARTADQAKQSWEMKRQLGLASEVQRRMVPSRPPVLEGFDIADKYRPSQQLSGDFYDYISLPNGNIGIVICDVVGKGVRASLLMASLRASLRAHAISVGDISEMMNRVNRDMVAGTLFSDFATMFYSELDVKKRTLTYCCAGHLPSLLIRGGKAVYLSTEGGMVGVVDEMEFPIESLDLEPGDVILMYTDGLVEAMNFKGEEYGRKRAEQAAVWAAGQGYNLQSIMNYCVKEMQLFAGLSTRKDDLTLVGIQAV
jgi:sigma-B regulation protein RsbU (phosphoserine phosphatase)